MELSEGRGLITLFAGMEQISGYLNCKVSKCIAHFCRSCAYVKFGNGHHVIGGRREPSLPKKREPERLNLQS